MADSAVCCYIVKHFVCFHVARLNTEGRGIHSFNFFGVGLRTLVKKTKIQLIVICGTFGKIAGKSLVFQDRDNSVHCPYT